jgi:ribosomal protein S18 acetylase RimI-like enzyme
VVEARVHVGKMCRCDRLSNRARGVTREPGLLYARPVVRDLAELDLPALTAAFNAVYLEYVVPLAFDPERMRAHVEANDIALDRSPLVLDDDGRVVALAMLGVRGDRGWIGGFGVVPAQRGRGRSHALTREVIERARASGLLTLQLEVIDANVRAIAAYERAGFVRTRALCSCRREPRLGSQHGDAAVAVEIGAFAWREAAEAWAPAWQRERSSVLRTPGVVGLATTAGEPFALVRPTDAAVHVLAMDACDEETAARRLDAVAASHADRAIVVMNEPEGSAVERAMVGRGWTAIVRQHELRLDL